MKKLNILLALLLILSYVLATFTSMAEGGFEDWKDTPTQVAKDKVWSVRLSQSVDPSSVNAENVFVEDESGTKIVNQLSVAENNTVIKVQPPTGGYEAGKRYTLYIKDLRGANGALLKQDIRMTFFVKGEVRVAEFKMNKDVIVIGKMPDNPNFHMDEGSLSEYDPLGSVYDYEIIGDGDSVRVTSEYRKQKNLKVGSLFAAMPNEKTDYGAGGRIVGFQERADGTTEVQLQQVPFYEMIEELKYDGDTPPNYKLNPDLVNTPGVTTESEIITIDGVEHQRFVITFDETPIVKDGEGRVSLLEPAKKWEVPIDTDYVSGKIVLDMPEATVNIDYKAMDLLKYGFQGFEAFEISVNPSISADLNFKFSNESKKTFDVVIASPDGPLLMVPMAQICGEIRLQAELEAKTSVGGGAVLHYKTGATMGVKKNGVGNLERIFDMPEKSTDFYLAPEFEATGAASVKTGLRIGFGLAFLHKKLAQIRIDAFGGLSAELTAQVHIKDKYQFNEEGDVVWFDATFEAFPFIEPKLLFDTAIPIFKHEMTIPTFKGKSFLRGSLKMRNKLMNVGFEKGTYYFEKGQKLKATAKYRKEIAVEYGRIGKKKTEKVYPWKEQDSVTKKCPRRLNIWTLSLSPKMCLQDI